MKSKLAQIDWDLKTKEKQMIKAYRALEKVEDAKASDKVIRDKFKAYIAARNGYMLRFGVAEIYVQEQSSLIRDFT